MGSFATYGRAGALMAEILPLDKAPGVETTRRRAWAPNWSVFGASSADRQAIGDPPSAQSIAVSLDGGHVKSIRSYQMRSFEVMLACASNDQGEQRHCHVWTAPADQGLFCGVEFDRGCGHAFGRARTGKLRQVRLRALPDINTIVSPQIFTITDAWDLTNISGSLALSVTIGQCARISSMKSSGWKSCECRKNLSDLPLI